MSKEYLRYVRFFVGFPILFFFLLIPINYLIFKSIAISVCFSFVATFEKISDEFQRFNIYSKKLTLWSSFAILMYSLPVILALLIFAFFKINLFLAYVFSSAFIYFFLLLYIIYSMNLFRLTKKSLFDINILIGSYKFYLNRILYVLVGASHGHAMIIFRYLILFFHPIFFPVYVACSSIIGFIPTAVDIFYLSYKRKNFVSNFREAKETLLDKNFYAVLTFSTFFSFFGCIGVLFSRDVREINIILVSAILTLSGIFYSISLIFYENMYWFMTIKERIKVDFIYYFLVILLFAFANIVLINLRLILVFFVLILFLRIIIVNNYTKIRGI